MVALVISRIYKTFEPKCLHFRSGFDTRICVRIIGKLHFCGNYKRLTKKAKPRVLTQLVKKSKLEGSTRHLVLLKCFFV